MADYPNLPIDNSSKVRASVVGINDSFDIAYSGDVRGRVTLSGESYDLTIRHRFLSASELASLDQFFAAYRQYPFTIDYGGDLYTVRFSRNIVRSKSAGNRWNADVFMQGVKN